jgi:ATP synthase protein I
MHTDKKDIESFTKQVGEKAQRKLNAMHEKKQSIWFGLGMFGMIGWSVTVPTLLGVAIGIWLDKHYPQSFSFTLNGLIVGILGGCYLAWHWVSKEHKDMNKKEEDHE